LCSRRHLTIEQEVSRLDTSYTNTIQEIESHVRRQYRLCAHRFNSPHRSPTPYNPTILQVFDYKHRSISPISAHNPQISRAKMPVLTPASSCSRPAQLVNAASAIPQAPVNHCCGYCCKEEEYGHHDLCGWCSNSDCL